MNSSPESFYDDLAESYHLIFEDWHRSIAVQAEVLGTILERCTGKASPYVLDCACGIGTQTIGLAERGHSLVGSDVSSSAIRRQELRLSRTRVGPSSAQRAADAITTSPMSARHPGST